MRSKPSGVSKALHQTHEPPPPPAPQPASPWSSKAGPPPGTPESRVQPPAGPTPQSHHPSQTKSRSCAHALCPTKEKAALKRGASSDGATAISGTSLGKTLRQPVTTSSGHHGKSHSGQAGAQHLPWESYPAAPAWPAAGESAPSSAEQGTCRSFTGRGTKHSVRPSKPRRPASDQVPSGGRRPVHSPQGREGQFSSSPPSLVFAPATSLHPKPSPAPGASLRKTQ